MKIDANGVKFFPKFSLASSLLLNVSATVQNVFRIFFSLWPRIPLWRQEFVQKDSLPKFTKRSSSSEIDEKDLYVVKTYYFVVFNVDYCLWLNLNHLRLKFFENGQESTKLVQNI
jgi:hypothetical protein